MTGDKRLGKVKRIIKSSGMLELTTGEKIPPFPNVEVGDTIEIKDKRYYVVGKGVAGGGKGGLDDKESEDIGELAKENKALKAKLNKQEARLKALEAKFGEKGERGEVDEN